MAEFEQPRHMDLSSKMIFWLLSFLSVIMTSIGGFTAAHVITQYDEILSRLSKMEAAAAAHDVFDKDIERRLDNLEQQLYYARKPQ